MSELGQVLQRTREEKGISLDDIQKVTKIQKRYLEAIERGHLHILPGHFYARAFIKSYAEAVGLDPNEILSHYQADLPTQPPQEQVERLRRRRVAQAKQSLPAGRWVMQTLLVCFVFLVAAVIYLAVVNHNGFDSSPIPGNNAGNVQPNIEQGTIAPEVPAGNKPTEPVTDINRPLPQQTQTPTAASPTLKLVNQQNANYFYTLSQGEKLSFTFKMTNGDCWVAVYDKKGGKQYAQGMFKKGEEKVIEAGPTAYVVIGRPPSVEMLVNGVPVTMSEIKSVPAYMHVSIQQPPQ